MLEHYTIFFLILYPPPRYTLFPYTTLFRSEKGNCTSCHRVNGKGSRVAPDLSDIGAIRSPDALRRSLTDPTDRKSTRLNSSHTVISYAVFCLKKKTKLNLRP